MDTALTKMVKTELKGGFVGRGWYLPKQNTLVQSKAIKAVVRRDT